MCFLCILCVRFHNKYITLLLFVNIIIVALPPSTTLVEVMSLFLFVCLFVYCKSNEPISVRLGVMIGPITGKNWLTVGGDLVPLQTTFPLPHHCGDRHCEIFISFSLTVNDRFSRNSAE